MTPTSILNLPFLLGIMLLFTSLTVSDPDPLQDYCVADTKKPQSMYINGSPCIDPDHATSSHFATSALSMPGNTSTNPSLFSVIITNNQNLPGHHTQGLTMARIDLAPNGLVPSHVHPRASEVTICLKGRILVGFIDTSGKAFTQTLTYGESFVFPKGMIHYLYNLDGAKPALLISGLSSESPGVQFVPATSGTS